MPANRFLVPFINLGHLLDHLAMLVFPTAVVAIGREWGRPYSELLPLALGSFIAFGAFAIPAGWLADHWTRYKTMVVFFIGIGLSLVATGLAQSPWQIALGLTVVGAFAAIYHPVGIAMLVVSPENMGRLLGWNGLWGNMGLAFAALLTGALVDAFGWRTAFFVPGVICVAAGVVFLVLVKDPGKVKKTSKSVGLHMDTRMLARVMAIMLVATACGGIIFNSTTIAMPKVFDERLQALTQTSFGVGALVAIVYTMAAFAQVLMGMLIDRMELRRLMIAVGLVQIPMLLLAANLEGWWMLGAALAMMLAVFGQIPLNDAIVGRYVADEFRARVLGVRYVVSLGVAAVAVPLIATLHKTAGGFANVFMVLAALASGIFLAAFFFPTRAELAAQKQRHAGQAQAA
ncbi:MAG: MFS transporter [Betaproteobacteria bacterium]|nr:MFS transporter [Betaproteobacteria bacterium]